MLLDKKSQAAFNHIKKIKLSNKKNWSKGWARGQTKRVQVFYLIIPGNFCELIITNLTEHLTGKSDTCFLGLSQTCYLESAQRAFRPVFVDMSFQNTEGLGALAEWQPEFHLKCGLCLSGLSSFPPLGSLDSPRTLQRGWSVTALTLPCYNHCRQRADLAAEGLRVGVSDRSPGSAAEARGIRERPGGAPGPRGADRGHRAGAQVRALCGCQCWHWALGPSEDSVESFPRHSQGGAGELASPVLS